MEQMKSPPSHLQLRLCIQETLVPGWLAILEFVRLRVGLGGEPYLRPLGVAEHDGNLRTRFFLQQMLVSLCPQFHAGE